MKTPVIIGGGIAAAAIIVAVLLGQNEPDFKCTPTESNILGPYYLSGVPEWQVPAGLPGERLVITGRVMDQNCEPVSGAVLDFWQADSNGFYDNTGYTLRGTISSGQDGRYELDTIFPGKYETRPSHIHVKVRLAGQDLLTSQLYFIQGDRDEFVRDSLILETSKQNGTTTASFDFVVRR